MTSLFNNHTYEDSEGNLHFADYQKQKEYIVPKAKLGTYKILKERGFGALAISLVLFGLKVPIYLCVAAGLLLVLLMSLFYKQKFMPQLQSNKLDASKIRKYEEQKNEVKDKCISVILISVIIICFALLNNYYQNYQETNIQAYFLSWAVAILCLINILKHIATLKAKGRKR